jgi:hypothetical protein
MKLKVSIPVVKKEVLSSSSWEKYKMNGTLEIEFDGEIDERRVNALLQKLDAQFLLIENSQAIGETIGELERRLTDTKDQLKTARSQLNRLAQFLESCGVNPRSSVLQFDERLKLRSAGTVESGNTENDNEECDEPVEEDD